MPSNQDRWRQEDVPERLFSSLAELAAYFSHGEEIGEEDPKTRVEDALTDYADWDVWVEEHEDTGSLEVRIRARGTDLTYPFTESELFETVDALAEEALQESDDADDWLDTRLPTLHLQWQPRGHQGVALRNSDHLEELMSELAPTAQWAMVRGEGPRSWVQTMRVREGWIIEVSSGSGRDTFAQRVQHTESGSSAPGPKLNCREPSGALATTYFASDVFASPADAAQIVGLWFSAGILPLGHGLRELGDEMVPGPEVSDGEPKDQEVVSYIEDPFDSDGMSEVATRFALRTPPPMMPVGPAVDDPIGRIARAHFKLAELEMTSPEYRTVSEETLADFRQIEASLLNGAVGRPEMLQAVQEAIEGLSTFLSVDWAESAKVGIESSEQEHPAQGRGRGSGIGRDVSYAGHEKGSMDHAAALRGLQASATKGGCTTCRNSRIGREKVSEELIDRVIERVKYDESRYASASYQNAMITRCSACGTLWLDQYWELETPETELQEWGERHWASHPMNAADLRTLEEAQATGRSLPHDYFWPSNC